ncbi:MAG: isoprenylcysteine carboxylmethyltransferase family protein [Bryobacteraceae bacterium]|jgi:protein-S-isoprenylcysteine O-methyltransferase Ste14
MTQTLDSARVRIPPPLIYAVGLGAGLLLSKWIPSRWLPAAICRLSGWTLVIAACSLAVPSLAIFLLKRTAIRPDRPATTLAVGGPYRLTRNPMYLSLALLYGGITILCQSIWALLFLFPVLFIIDRHVIVPEELYLERRFGSTYAQYKTRVRRWI